MAISTLHRKGQTTIPKVVRDRLGLRAGDRMEFILDKNTVVLRAPTRDIRDLKGMLPKPKTGALNGGPGPGNPQARGTQMIGVELGLRASCELVLGFDPKAARLPAVELL